MPVETQEAVDWALLQTVDDGRGNEIAVRDYPYLIVDKVREYFNTNKVAYSTFSYNDLKPYL